MEEPAIESVASPGVADLLGVALALDADEFRDPAELRKRDRALGLALEAARVTDPARRLVAWVEQRGDDVSESAARLRMSLRVLAGLLALAGFLLGWAASLAALAFQAGAGRINVVLVLALLVLAPFALFVLSVVASLPELQARRIPGVELLSAGLRSLSAGRLALRLVPAERRDALAALWGRGVGQSRLYAATRRWLLLALSQAAALAFGLGALVGTLGLVVFTDLAFGWSTTLELDAAGFLRAVTWLSLPWAGLWSAAVPSAELVEATRFFRVDPSVPDAIDPALYGGWWPFLVSALTVYVVLPRALWATFCAWRLRRAVRGALLQTAGASEVLERMQSPLIEMHHAGDVLAAGEGAETLGEWNSASGAPASLICWARAAEEAELTRLFATAAPAALHAGGAASLVQDELAIAAVRSAAGSVAVVVRGYEPPVADLLDFLRDLRFALGDGRMIEVLPLGADAANLQVWSRALAQLGDPWLRAVRPEADS